MTIPNEITRCDYIGNGTTSVFAYTFKIFSKNDILVTRKDAFNVETSLVVDVDFTVSDIGAISGGNVVLTAGVLPVNYTLTIRRRRALTQETDIRNQGPYLPEVIENAFDDMVMKTLTLQGLIDRCFKLAETQTGLSSTLPLSSALQIMRVNAANTGLEFASAVDVSAALTTVDDSLTLSGQNLRVTKPVRAAVATGTPNTITAAFLPPITAFVDGTLCLVVVSGVSTSTAPTFAPDALAPKTIKKLNGQALLPSDIPGAGWVAVLVYSASLDAWILTNPTATRPLPVGDDTSPTANTLTVSYPSPFTGYYDGMVFVVRPAFTNTSQTVTLNVNGLGAFPVYNASTGALPLIGDIPAGTEMIFLYYNSAFRLVNPFRPFPWVHSHANSSLGGILDYTGMSQISTGLVSTYVGSVIYQAGTDLIVHAFVDVGNNAALTIVADTTSPPTTYLVRAVHVPNETHVGCVTAHIRKGEYWSLTSAGGVTIRVRPIGV